MKILMYHYVRPLESSRYPALKGRHVRDFQGQLAYLRKHFYLCSPVELFDCLRAGEPVPKTWALLTFDDGYADHFRYVFPSLLEAKTRAFFFPPVSVVTHRRLLDVNKIHFVLAAAPSLSSVYHRLLAHLNEFGMTAEDVELLRQKYYHPNRFDAADTVFVKRVLQKGLCPKFRAAISSLLFSEFVSADERAFAEELYLTMEDCRTMAREGMAFGSHGSNHCWMGELSEAEQRTEILESVELLRKIHTPDTTPLKELVMCYPYGSYNAYTIAELERQGFLFALTTKVGDAEFLGLERYEVKRYDTNDFPVCEGV